MTMPAGLCPHRAPRAHFKMQDSNGFILWFGDSMQRTLMEKNNTLELVTSNGIVTLTIVGYPNARATPPAALVMGYLTDNPILPTITCTSEEARRLGNFILRAAESAESLRDELAAARKGERTHEQKAQG